jgi:hypothetical protein
VKVATSIAIACVLVATSAHAQTNQAAATAQFDQGRALMKQKSYTEACKAFETSQKLDPQMGTLFNLADCHAHLGKIATAWLEYRDLGQRDTNAGRKKEANRRAKELDKRMPHLVLDIATPPSGFAVTINGDDATQTIGIESPVDLGKLAIRATAPGYAPFETTKSITVEGKTVHVAIEITRGGDAAPGSDAGSKPASANDQSVTASPAPNAPDESYRETSHRQRNGKIVALAGGGAIAIGAVFGLRARSEWNDAQLVCPVHTCGTADARTRGDSLVDSARSNAALATGFAIAGAAVAAVGIYYAVTGTPAPTTTSLRFAPATGGAIVGLGRSF